MRGAALLRADLHDAIGASGDLLHPLALAHEKVQRLFEIHVFARIAGQHHLQRVPVVAGVHHDCIDILAL